MKGARINYREGNGAHAATESVAYSQSDIKKLVERAVSGNFEAFGKLYYIYVEKIYKYVFYQVKDKMTAEDITADVFVKALDKIKSCKGKEATFSSWLYRIAYNRTIDNFRMSSRILALDTEFISNLDDPKQELGKSLEWQELLEAISQLPQNQRQFIILKFIEGLDNREIGHIMGRSQIAVRLLQFRALTSLRKKVGSG